MQLHYRLHEQSSRLALISGLIPDPIPSKTPSSISALAAIPSASPAIVLLHGLFGSLDNLGCLVRGLQGDHPILSVDLRNHGLSPHHAEMSYPVMAHEVQQLLQLLSLNQVVVIGHSMGGKVAMALALLAPQRIRQLVVLDIAPVSYPRSRCDYAIFDALQAVSKANILERNAAASLLRYHTIAEPIVQFLLKSFYQGSWRFNLPALQHNYPAISSWSIPGSWHGPACFVSGQNSYYLQPESYSAVLRTFPQAVIHTIPDAGHWLHAEQTTTLLQILRQFIADPGKLQPLPKSGS